MKIPNFETTPIGILNKETGEVNLHPVWNQTLQQLFTQMQQNLSDQGFKIPQQPTATVTKLNNAQSTSALIIDSDTNELKVNLGGTFKVVQTV